MAKRSLNKLSDKIERELKRADYEGRAFWVVHRTDEDNQRFEVKLDYINSADATLCEIRTKIKELSLKYAGDFLEASSLHPVKNSYLLVVLENGQALEVKHESAPKMFGDLEARFYDLKFFSLTGKKEDTSLTGVLTRIAEQAYGLNLNPTAYDTDVSTENGFPFILDQDYEQGKILQSYFGYLEKPDSIVSSKKVNVVEARIAQRAPELSVQSFAEMLRLQQEHIKYLALNIDSGIVRGTHIFYNPLSNPKGQKSSISVELFNTLPEMYPRINAAWQVYSKETGAKLRDVK